MPLTVLAFGAPVWAGLAAAAVAMAALLPVGGLLRRRSAPTRLQPALQTALADALPALQSLEDTAPTIAAPGVRAEAMAIAAASREIIAAVSAAPERLPAVQRLLTYYLPSAAELFSAYRNLEKNDAHADRRQQIQLLAPRLGEIFRRFGDARRADDVRLLDTEIRLLDAALRDDLGA